MMDDQEETTEAAPQPAPSAVHDPRIAHGRALVEEYARALDRLKGAFEFKRAAADKEQTDAAAKAYKSAWAEFEAASTRLHEHIDKLAAAAGVRS